MGDRVEAQWILSAKYGMTIGKEIRKGHSLEDAVRFAYKEHGVIPVWKLYLSLETPFLHVMREVSGTICHSKTELINQKLTSTLFKISREMKSQPSKRLLKSVDC